MHKLYSSNLNDIEKQNLRIEVLNQFKNSSLKPSEFCKLYGGRAAYAYSHLIDHRISLVDRFNSYLPINS